MVDDISAVFMARLPRSKTIVLHFVLPGWPDGERNPEEPPALYAIPTRDHRGDADRVRSILPWSTLRARAAVAKFQPLPGENVRGIWIDHYRLGGLVALITGADGAFYYANVGASLDKNERWLMREEKSPLAGRWFVAVANTTTNAKGRAQTYKADGIESSRFAIWLPPDGTLRRFNEHEDDNKKLFGKPWIIAKPWSE